MGRYLNAVLDYLPAALAAAGGFSMLAGGVGSEISDLLHVEPEMTRMGVDIIVSQTGLVAGGALGATVRHVANNRREQENYS
jgi:hypothetical protein